MPRSLRWLLIVGAALIAVQWLRHQLAIDDCLDDGGRWDYDRNVCEGRRERPESN
jgi:hypothetical protein